MYTMYTQGEKTSKNVKILHKDIQKNLVVSGN